MMIDTAEAAMDNKKEVMMVNTRINGAPPLRRNNGNQLDRNRWKGYSYEPDPDISETKCASTLQLDICLNPKPKPDIFVNYCDSYPNDYFVAYSLEEDGNLSPKYSIYLPTFLAKQEYYFTTATCNGLFHYYDEKSDNQLLWNPTTGGYKILPNPFMESHPRITYCIESYGLWSDHTFEDYKVLNLVSAFTEDERGYLLDVSYHIDLYSLKHNSWKRIPCPDFHCGYGSTGACVAGVFYIKAILGKRTNVILSFDFSTETLSSLPSPHDDPNLYPHHYYFLEYKGLLSALACWYDKGNRYRDVPLKYELWIMSDGSWTRESVFHTRGVVMLLWFSQDGKLLYFASSTDELVIFDRATGELKHLGVDWSSANHRTRPMMIPFSETFVQLN